MAGAREKFKLIKVLGTGGFGTTYLADTVDARLKERWGTPVVLKVPKSREAGLCLIEGDFAKNEMLRVLAPSAVYFVKNLGIEIYDDQYVLCMEFCSGGSLRQKLGDLGRSHALPFKEALSLMGQIAAGVGILHEACIFHRDLSPDNILFDGKGAPKISDFGIAKLMDTNEPAQSIAGKIIYMPPEELRGIGGSFYSDVFSLGVVFYEMTAGTHPFLAPNYQAVFDLICTKDPPAPHEVNAEVDRAVSRLIHKMLAKDPKDRFPHGGAVAAELRKLTESNVEQTMRLRKDEPKKGKKSDILDGFKGFGSSAPAKPKSPPETPPKATSPAAGEEPAAPLLPQAPPVPAEPEGIERSFKQAITGDPQSVASYLKLGQFYNQSGRHEEALAIFEEGLRRVPNSPVLLWQKALALRRLKRNKSAITALMLGIDQGLPGDLLSNAKCLLRVWEKETAGNTASRKRT